MESSCENTLEIIEYAKGIAAALLPMRLEGRREFQPNLDEVFDVSTHDVCCLLILRRVRQVLANGSVLRVLSTRVLITI